MPPAPAQHASTTSREGRAETPRKTRPTWRAKLVAAALSIAFALLALEAGVRMTVGAPLPERLPILRIRANEHRGWEMVPSETHYTYEHEVRVNALGLRGREVEEKHEGEVRVLALGDSLVYGQGVADDQTLPAHLERELAARDATHTYTVVNGGLRAYDTRQELGLLDELVDAIAPDVVVLFWYRNDLIERDIEGTFERLSKRGEPIAFDIGEPLRGWAEAKWRAKQLVRRSALVMYLYDLTAEKQTDTVFDGAVEEGIERLEQYLARFRALAEAKGFVPLFAVVPVPDLVALEAPERGPDARALDTARAAGFEPIDLFDAARGAFLELGRLPTVPFDGHFDGEGNAALAAEVAKRVLERVPADAPTRE